MIKFFPPTEYVSAMQELLKLELSKLAFSDYCEAVAIVQKATETPLDIVALNQTLMATDMHAGEYRQSAVHTLRGSSLIERDLPRYTAVTKLMFSFKRAYKKALSGAVPDGVVNYEYLAWSVAANGRCLHPFRVGNTRLFMLVENHIRQVYGLPWRIDMCTKEKFDEFRNAYKKWHHEHY